jgi:CheY-like chemotaxis protein
MRNLRILCVEDHRDTAEGLGRLLRLWGCNATAVYSYRDAVAAAKAQHFDLLLIDIGLADGDGCDLLREIQRSYPIRGIALSGYGMPRDVERCLTAGYLYHLLKPVSAQRIEEVLGAVAKVIVKRPTNKDGGQSQKGGILPPVADPPGV